MFWKILVVLSAASSLVAAWFTFDFRRTDYLTSNDVNSIVLSSFTLVTNSLPNILQSSQIVPSSGIAGQLIAPSNPSEKPAPNKKQVLRGEYNFHQCGNLKWVDFDGDDFRLGAPSEYGRVILIDEFYTICLDDEGNQTILRSGLSDYERELRRRSAPPRVSLQAGRARTGGAEVSH